MNDVVAPRADGSLARYRFKNIGGAVYAVDQEMSQHIVNTHSRIPKSMKAADRLYGHISVLILVGGFVALIWLPWYTPIIGTVVALVVFRANKASASDFVADVASDNGEFLKEMEELGVCIARSDLRTDQAEE